MDFKSEYIAPVGAKGLNIINTGDWRNKRPILDNETCISCGSCLMYCPVNSIRKDGKKFYINYDYCKGCGICAHECPKDAITMVEEEEK